MNETPHLPIKQLIVVLSLCLIFFLFPNFSPNTIILGHDTFLHTVYIHKFINAFFEGQFPVRVIDWIFPGANIPVFNFYQPGFYYLMLFFKLFGLSYSGALNFGLLFLWLFSGVGMYLFVKNRVGFLGGILSGLLFIFAPYHIVDIFVRTAFPEFTALAFFPWIFYLLSKYQETQKERYGFFLSVTVAIAALSHPPTFVMFVPLIVTYIFFLNPTPTIALKKISISLLLGLLLIAFFIIPVFTEQQYVHMELTYTDKLFDFHNHFVCLQQLYQPTWGYGLSVKGCNDNLSLQLGIVHWIIVALAIIFVTIGFFHRKVTPHKKEIIFAGINILFLFLALFMTLSISQPIWDYIPYLRFVEFPWRFLALAIFVSSYLGGYVISQLSKKKAYVLYGLLVYGIFYWYIPYLHANLADATEFNKVNYLVSDPNFMSSRYSPQQTFFPKTTKKLPDPKNVPTTEAESLSGKGDITQILSTASRKEYVVSLTTPSTLRFFIHYFPGWTIYVDNRNTPVSFANSFGYSDVTISAGKHTVTVIFRQTISRAVGDILSLLTLLFLPFWYTRKFKVIHKKSER